MPANPPIRRNENNRKHARVKYAADVTISVNQNKYMAELLDLSLGGAFIALDSIPQIEAGERVSIEIPFINKPGEVAIQGTVRRLDGTGAGVEFF